MGCLLVYLVIILIAKKLNDDNIKVEKRLSERNFLATNGFIYSISNEGEVSRNYNVDINDYENVVMEKT